MWNYISLQAALLPIIPWLWNQFIGKDLRKEVLFLNMINQCIFCTMHGAQVSAFNANLQPM